MLWKVLSEFPGEDQSTPPLRFGDITNLSYMNIICISLISGYCAYICAYAINITDVI